MKKFLRTVAGKTILFIVCVLAFAILIGSVAGIMVVADETGYTLYTHTEDEIVRLFSQRFFGTVESGTEGLYQLFVWMVRLVYSMRYTIFVIVALALIVSVSSYVALLCVSGRRPDTEEVFPGILHKVPYDLLAVIGIGFCVVCVLAISGEYMSDLTLLMLIAVISLISLSIFLGLSMSLAVRIKTHTLVKNTVIWRVLVLVWKVLCCIWSLIKRIADFIVTVIRNLPIVWKTGIAAFAFFIIECACYFGWRHKYSGEWDFSFVLVQLLIVFIAIYSAICLRKLQKGGRALAQGNLGYITDTKGLFLDFKEHGENLNSIAVGMGIAVEDRLKSERMKTELITNVSHDLKTPLTSIINYATLIGNEECENERITEYSEVLVRQSEKLKRLIEDLVEASKASTGNLDVNLAQCDASVFLAQASGEYEDKLAKSELTLIAKQPENELRIMADGRRMWRIFDNLMNNICKYSLPGTRVYLSLDEINGKAVFTFRNTSKEALNLSEDELMERFTRGDSSRNTEGNGLGLSIAKSMAELQGGELKVSTDGDLFKAILSFPII